MRFICSLAIVAVILSGCAQHSNPNDLSMVLPEERVEVAHNLMLSLVSKLEEKFRNREITNREREFYIEKYAEEIMPSISAESIPNSSQWIYGDLLRITKRWPEAEKAFAQAVKYAASPDRKVNDTLRLAQAMAMNGKVQEAIKTARSVYDAKDEESAPILPATLYEVVPAAEGKGFNKELAALLKEAIVCHKRVKVDVRSENGKLFLGAMQHHIGKAEVKAQILATGG